MRGILEVVPPAATLDEALDPLRADPTHSAVLLDVDGTLAPIVRHAADAHVPEATRGLLIEIARRYGVVGVVSGRRAAVARQMVSIGTIAYVGNHGAEVLRPGATRAELDSELEPWAEGVRQFARRWATSDLQKLRVRGEDKDVIAAFHWRGAPDEEAAEAAVRAVADDAEAQGLHTHWGRKVLEVRPPVRMDKGKGVTTLLRDQQLTAALYVGDDTTDIDAFRALREMVADGTLTTAVCAAVASDEAPEELAREADVTVEGTGGVRRLLEALLG